MDDRQNGGHNEDIARLRGSRLVLTSETEKSKRLAEALVKRLTGQEMITASFKHERSFEFMPRFKIWLAANHKPVIQGTDYGIWRRILLIPFNAKFVKPGVDLAENHFRIDPNLRRDLLAELPGILNWGVEGFRKWRELGLAAPSAVRAASEGYREESDRLGAFLSEEMIEGDGLTASLASAYQAYSSWCENGGMKPGTIRTLASDLRGRGVEVRKYGVKCVMSVIGYGLRQSD
jgi:putative DNA primase/helicase